MALVAFPQESFSSEISKIVDELPALPWCHDRIKAVALREQPLACDTILPHVATITSARIDYKSRP
jgi:hypothetical protein